MTGIAISLWQPWATALFIKWQDGEPLKPDETRKLRLPPKYIGKRVGIHAAKSEKGLRDWQQLPAMIHEQFAAYGFKAWHDLPRGVLLGEVVFSGDFPTETRKRQLIRCQHLLGDYLAGRHAWKVAEATRYPNPLPCLGRQGWFRPELKT